MEEEPLTRVDGSFSTSARSTPSSLRQGHLLRHRFAGDSAKSTAPDEAAGKAAGRCAGSAPRARPRRGLARIGAAPTSPGGVRKRSLAWIGFEGILSAGSRSAAGRHLDAGRTQRPGKVGRGVPGLVREGRLQRSPAATGQLRELSGGGADPHSARQCRAVGAGRRVGGFRLGPPTGWLLQQDPGPLRCPPLLPVDKAGKRGSAATGSRSLGAGSRSRSPSSRASLASPGWRRQLSSALAGRSAGGEGQQWFLCK